MLQTTPNICETENIDEQVKHSLKLMNCKQKAAF